MANEPSPTYEVDRLPEVTVQIRQAAARASDLGIRKQFLEGLKSFVQRLERDPIGWGEPRYHTRKSGGLVCQRIELPLNIHYVVYEEERKVVILDLQLLAGPST